MSKYTYQAWPCACDGPNGESEIFASEAEVPAGWTHHGEAKAPKAPKVPKEPKPPLQDL
jgi:uncharacterized protein YbdZ (MbtH family)